MDALDELALHPHLQRALLDAGFGVHREVRYPADRGKRRHSEGERCDLVLTPDRRPLATPEGSKTPLFEPPDAVPLDEAFWLEAKVVAQHTMEGPNRHYAAQLLSGVRPDVRKLSKDPSILHAGLLIVLFARDAATAEHDLHVWHERCLDLALPVAHPCRRAFPITDRLGNAACALALHPVAHL